MGMGTGRRGGRGAGLAAGLVVACVLAVGGLAGAGPAVAAARAGAPPVHGARAVAGVARVPFRPVKVSGQASRRFTASEVRWPGAASGVIRLAAPRTTVLPAAPSGASAAAGAAPVWRVPAEPVPGAARTAAGTPAWAQAVAPAHGAYAGPSSVRVDVESQAVASRLGIHGVVWRLSGLAGGAGSVRAGISYRSFGQAFGGNYGARLTVVELPACALSTPGLARCRKAVPLRSVNDYRAQTVSAVLPLSPGAGRLSPGAAPAGSLPGSVVLAAMTTSAGANGGVAGTYGVTSLKPSGSWVRSGSSGSFTDTYPVAVPGSSSKLVPSPGLSYDSGSVDGQTAATQAQANWAGDGWSTGDSFIEQSFTPCNDSPEGVTLPAADQTQDMCYDGNVLTLSLDGTTTALVRDGSTGTWRLQADDGSTVTHVTNSGNGTGTYNTDYWTVTRRDGTRYYFGMNRLPGWASGDTATDSVDSEPVYSSQPGDPCYSASGFSSSVCTMAYRWHLDYVTDVHGDAMAYYYGQSVNYYGQDNGAKDVSYVRDSYLKETAYGFRAGGAYGAVPDRVVYGTSPRCVESSCPPLSASDSGSAGTAYPDVPYDLNCDAGSTCSVYGPTYWSTVRLTSITTRQYSASAAAYQNVDTYTLAQTEPPTEDGTSPTLWLASVTRTGDDTGGGGSSSPAALPAVTFSGTDLPNRVDTASFPGLYRYRVTAVTSELGGVTRVTYGTPDTCTASYVEGITTNSEAASNTRSCYPVWWTPPGYTAPVMDWFEKYAVTRVLESDTTGGAPAVQDGYTYSGGAAWHYDDNEVVQAKYRTYGQFRGYASVTTTAGDGVNDPQTEKVTAYYRGMSDDNNSTAVTLTDSQGGTHDDANQLAGLPLETTVYNGKGGPVDHSAVDSYWVSAATATRDRSGLPALTADMVEPAEKWTRQALTDGGTTGWRYTETDTTYDTTAGPDLGLPARVYTHTVPADPAYDRCTSTTYAPVNTAENLAGLVASAETDSVACSGFTEGSPASVPAGLNTLGAPSPVSRPAQVVSATETFYDDPGFSTAFPQAAAPTAGNVTMTRSAVTYASGAFTWQTTARHTYDSYGRVLDAWDGNGNLTATAYTLAVGLTTAVTVTNPLSQTVTRTLDPARGLTLTSTDANGIVTTTQYDGLGRTTSVWLDSRAVTAEPNDTYAYTVSRTGVSGTVAKKMGENLGYATTVTIVDSLGRTRQTQTDTPQGGRVITDKFYDSRGWTWKTNNRYWDSSAPPALSLVTPTTNGGTGADGQVPDQDVYTFNGLGQVVQDTSRAYANTVSVTTTVRNGDRTTVIPPPGGTVTSTRTDPFGRTAEVDEYTAPPALVTPADTFTGTWYVTGGTATATTYAYDGHGDPSAVTDAAGNTWTTTRNILGEATAKTTPDAGTATMSYDANGNLTQETDARGDTVSFTYDSLNRKTGEYAPPAIGRGPADRLLASWVYDNANNVSGVTDPVGHLTTETSYSGGAAYVVQQTGFNEFGESLGQEVTIPAAAGALAGTYTFSHSYTGNAGLPYADVYPSAGGLPSEVTLHTYLSTPLNLPKGLGGTIAGYAANTDYDAYGKILQEEIGSGTDTAYITSTYDPHTQRLTGQLTSRSVATPASVDNEQYAYDPYGNITRQASTRLGSTATSETQCYAYDHLDRLTTAWTATDNCAATPTPASHSTVGDPLGASSEYWTTWTYDLLGDMTTKDQHSPAGGTDTITANTYNGNSTGQPHTLTTAATTGATTSTSTFAYDKSGNMTTRDVPATGNQALTWNVAAQLTTVTSTTNGTTSYVYAANGNLLLQKDPSTQTLYLPGEQITLNTATGTETGARIIPLPSGGDVVRTGTATASYYFEIPDTRGTNTLYLDNTAQTPTWRQFTPYGGPRGTPVTWIDNRGYLNKPNDTTTGLTYIGARAYDPRTTQFITPDPIVNPTNPQDLNPYAYAQDNPVTNSDPTGLMPCLTGGPCGSYQALESYPAAQQKAGGGTSGGTYAGGGGTRGGGAYTGGRGTGAWSQERQRQVTAALNQFGQDNAHCDWNSLLAALTGCGTLGHAAKLLNLETGTCLGGAAFSRCLAEGAAMMIPLDGIAGALGAKAAAAWASGRGLPDRQRPGRRHRIHFPA